MIKEGERIDETGFGDILLIQKPEEFCYGVDAVILADFASGVKPEKVVDLGTGTGIVPLILSHKTKASKLMGVEIQKDSYQRALRNVSLNGLEGRLSFINADVADMEAAKSILEGVEAPNGVDLVTSNPPYMKECGVMVNDNEAKRIARHETTATLEDFCKMAGRLLKDRGHFFMVHRPSRLVDIICSLRAAKLEPKEIRFVVPKPGAEPNIVLIHAVKNGGSELKILENLCVRDEQGEYSKEINEIYERS